MNATKIAPISGSSQIVVSVMWTPSPGAGSPPPPRPRGHALSEEAGDGGGPEPGGGGWTDPADHGEHSQDGDRDEHHRRRLMGVLDRALRRGLAPEREPPHAARVEPGQQRGRDADR